MPSPFSSRKAVIAFSAAVSCAFPSAQRAWAQGATVSSPAELALTAGGLKPGEWVWAPNVAPDGPLIVYVDLSSQLATVYRNGIRIAVSTVSSGRPGYATPTGVFTILQKDADHHSNRYHDAAMPFQERLTWDGVALHAGGLPGHPDSHGCIHLPYSFAKALFGITTVGATVVVQGEAFNHMRTSTSSVLAPIDEKGGAAAIDRIANGGFAWHPELAPSGPMNIIISKSDQRIVVLRNGIEIGRSVAQITEPDTGSHVVTYASDPDGKPHWIYVGLPGHDDEAGKALDEAALNRVLMPRAFYAAVKAQVRLGTTILITESGVGSDGAGEHVTILDGVSPQI